MLKPSHIIFSLNIDANQWLRIFREPPTPYCTSQDNPPENWMNRPHVLYEEAPPGFFESATPP